MKYYVYKFMDGRRKILYIGKTKDLMGRIKTHFQRGHLVDECYRRIKSIEYIVFDSAVAMDIYEIHFINKFKPIFNTASKRDADEFELKDGNLEWKSLNLEDNNFKYKKKEKKESKYDFGEILVHQKLFIEYAKIRIANSPEPLNEQKRIEDIMKDAAIRVYTDRS